MGTVNWTLADRFVSYFSPEAGMRRYRARMAEHQLEKVMHRFYQYEGAARGRRTASWVTNGSSANTAAGLSIPMLRDRSRDLVRNNPYSTRSVNVLTRNVVGAGIIPTPNGKTKGKNALAKSLFSEWGESTICDLTNQSNFYGLQRLAFRGVFEGGSVFIRKIRGKNDSAVPLQLQLLEGDFLDRNRTLLRKNPGENFILQGIEFSPQMKPVAYWLYPEHPGGYVTGMMTGIQSHRVPASEVIHLFRIDRIGQIDGVPWLAPAILRIRDLDELEDAWLSREKIAACFAAFVHDIDATIEAPPGDDDEKEDLIERVEPGMIEHLPPGKDIKFGSPPAVQGSAEFARNVLRGISVGTDVTYEQLTGDYSQVNFSSARRAHLEFRKAVVEHQWQIMIPKFCNGIWQWFTEAATIGGNNILGVSSKWAPPAPEMLEVDKETRANTALIRSGQKSWSQVIREGGEDPDEVLAEVAEDFKKFDKLGLALDCDPRRTSGQGNSQTIQESGGTDGSSGEVDEDEEDDSAK